MKKFCFLLILIVVCAVKSFAQAPSDNPYRSQYQPAGGHWTDTINWANTLDVTTIGATPNDNIDDHAAITQGIATLNQQGGGVLYFPAGVYKSSETVVLKSGVILRGPNISGVTDARQSGFQPGAVLEFPKYVFDTLANNGAGTDNSTAFKDIEGEYRISNSGVINLEVARAQIIFQPRYNTSPSLPFTTPQPMDVVRNIIVMGVKSHNAVTPAPDVPTTWMKPWQRFPWRFSSNIEIMVQANCVVANNRLNDGPIEDFQMENYRIEQRNSGGNYVDLRLNQDPKFDYNSHYGISVNRGKIAKNPTTGLPVIYGVVTYARPEQEPTLYAPGIEILDNWVYKTNRVAIIAAGNGLKIVGNIMKDDPTKPGRENFLGPTGRLTPQGATTFENRGIDFSGWNVYIAKNDVEAYRHRSGGYLSTDGEGILLQECCGGTPVNDYTIVENNMRGGNYIGIYKMRDIVNVNISRNNMNGGPIWVWANTNGGTFTVANALIDSNYNVNDIDVNGSVIGARGFITRNLGSGRISMPCYVEAINNSGFNNPTINNNGGIVCLPNTTMPLGIMTSPAADTSGCFNDTAATYTFRGKLLQGDPATTTVNFMLNNQVIAFAIAVNLVDSSFSYTWRIPFSYLPTQHTATFQIVGNGPLSYTRTISFTTNCPFTLSNPEDLNFVNSFEIYPNPAKDKIYFAGLNADGNYTSTITDLSGKTIASENLKSAQMEVSGLKSGVYLVRISGANQSIVKRLIID